MAAVLGSRTGSSKLKAFHHEAVIHPVPLADRDAPARTATAAQQAARRPADARPLGSALVSGNCERFPAPATAGPRPLKQALKLNMPGCAEGRAHTEPSPLLPCLEP